MPGFEASVTCKAPAEEVWKLLYDPVRYPEWWAGVDRVETDPEGGVTRFTQAWPDFAYPTTVTSEARGGRVVISCLISTIEHEWTLEPVEGGGCVARVRVRVPEEEAGRVEGLRSEVLDSLPRLARAAELGS